MTEPRILDQRIKLPYRYTAGAIHEEFLRALVDQRVLGGKCGDCETLYAPARPFCPACSGRTAATAHLTGEGSLISWTTVQRQGTATTFGLVRLDGTSNTMLHRVEVDPGDLRTGLRVRPRWAADRRPEITAIEAFVAID